MPDILLDTTRLAYRSLTGTLPTGIDRVCLAYVARYGDRARAVLCLGPFSAALPPGFSRRLFAALTGRTGAAPWLSLAAIAYAFLAFWVPLRVRGAVLINTGHVGLENPRYAWALRRLGAVPVAMVHDLIPIRHPEYCRPREHPKHLRRMRTAVTACRGIIANSQHTLDDLIAFCNAERLKCPPATVAALAPGLAGAEPGARPLEASYFVMLGTIEPRKNHWLILHLWRRLVVRHGPDAPRLIIIGQRGWECENVVDMLERCRPLQGVVVEMPACTDAELATWLHHAQALLFPSFAEGYGLPVVEALSRGVPVIASELPVFREIAGDIPDYADPLDAAAWQALVEEYTPAASPRREEQKWRMKRFRAATWEAHFQQVDALMARIEAVGTAAPARATA